MLADLDINIFLHQKFPPIPVAPLASTAVVLLPLFAVLVVIFAEPLVYGGGCGRRPCMASS